MPLLLLLLAAAGPLWAASDRSGPLLTAEVLDEVQAARSRSALSGFPPLDLSLLLAPPGLLQPQEPRDWLYRNPVTGALARTAGGGEGRYQAGILALEGDQLEAADEAFAGVRASYQDHPRSGDAAFWLAEIRRRQGRTDEAIGFLRLVQGTYGAEGAYRLGWLLKEQGRNREAAAAWAALAFAVGPFRVRASVALAVTRLALGEAGAARAPLDSILAEPTPAPGSEADARYAALLPLALSCKLTGDLAGAERALQRLLLARPDHPAAQTATVALGWILLEAGRPTEAERRLAWALRTALPEPLADRARLGRLISQIDLGETEGAVESLGALGGRQPWAAEGRLALAWLHLRQRKPASAQQLLHEAPETLEPAAPLAAFIAGESLRLLGRPAEAVSRFASVPRDSGLFPAAQHGRGLALLDAGDAQGAADALEALLKEAGGYSGTDSVRLSLAEAWKRTGRVGQAARTLAEVSPASQILPDALRERASIALLQGRCREASTVLSRFLEFFPSDPNRQDALLTLARAQACQGAFGQALEALSSLESLNPPPEMARQTRIERGWIFALAGRQEARAMVQEELAASPPGPSSARLRGILGWIDAGAGRCGPAVEHLDAALTFGKLPDTDAPLRIARVRCLHQLDRCQEALQDLPLLGDSADAFYASALCLGELGRLKELEDASGAFSRAVEDESDPRVSKLSGLLSRTRLAAADKRLRGGDAAGALALYEAVAHDSGPERISALKAVAEYRSEHGTRTEALQAWDNLAAAGEGEERCRALRTAATWAERAGDLPAARDRLERALAACPRRNVQERQTILVALGEVQLQAGEVEGAHETLRRAADAALGPSGLRALRLLGESQEAAGRDEEALETYLRIGYLYGLADAAAAESLLRAASMLGQKQQLARARALYQWVAREAQGNEAEQARQALDALAGDERRKSSDPATGVPSPMPSGTPPTPDQ